MAGAGGGGGNRATAVVPSEARKMVQSLKEIVNFPEAEIYAMLKECGMDPDEAVDRLLSQDTFHEVKSKREKKKETKEILESRPRVSSSTPGSRVGLDRGERSISTQFNSNDSGVNRGKHASKKENETSIAPASSILGPILGGSNLNRVLAAPSGPASTEGTFQATSLDEGISSKQSPAFQHSWRGKPGHISMADVVKMGRPQGKSSNTTFVPSGTSSTPHNGFFPSISQHNDNHSEAIVPPSESVQDFHSSQVPISQIAESTLEPSSAAGQYISHDDWTPMESSAGSRSAAPKASWSSAGFVDPSVLPTLHVDEADLKLNAHLDEIQVLEEKVNENIPVESISSSLTDRQIEVDSPENNFQADNWSYHSQRHTLDHEEGSRSAAPKASWSSAGFVDPSVLPTLHVDEADLKLNAHLDEIQVLEEKVNENIPVESISSSLTDRQIEVDSPENNFQADNWSYHSQRHTLDHEEAEDVNVEISVVSTNFQNLRIDKEELATSSSGNKPAVIIPSHLQVTNADCSYLSFGSFGSGINAPFSGSYPSKSIKNDLEMAPHPDNSSSLDQLDDRNLEYYNNGQLHSTSDDNLAPKSGTDTVNYNIPSTSEPDRSDTSDAVNEHQYNLPSVSGYELPNTTEQIKAAYSYSQANSQMQNIAPFSNILQQHTDPLQSSLLAPNVQALRDFDFSLSPLLATQAVPTKYSSVSSVSGSTTSTSEVNPGIFSTSQPTPQTLHGISIASGPGLPQHLPLHPYTQPTLPIGHFANMISYPSFLPYTYLPSAAFQQAYTGNGPFHPSLSAVPNSGMKYTLPQYKNSVSVASLLQSATVPSGYGGFGSSTNIPGSFGLNPSVAAASAAIRLDEVLSMQYKEGNQFAPPQQAENSASWLHGTNSRTMPVLPSNTFHSFQGQNQQSGYRQSQQPSHFGAMGYPNLYQLQPGASQEHQQSLSEGNLRGTQGLPSQHIWQHGY